MYPQQPYIHEKHHHRRRLPRNYEMKDPLVKTAVFLIQTIIMIVNTLTLANAWMFLDWPTQKPSHHSLQHAQTHIKCSHKYHAFYFTHAQQNDTFIPSAHVDFQMKYIHRRQSNLKHVRPQFCRSYRNSLILSIRWITFGRRLFQFRNIFYSEEMIFRIVLYV